MKRISFLLITVLSMTVSNAQDITDALRYGTENINGTARFNALSGAFNALGGDVSSMAINPAGSAVFLTNSLSISLDIKDIENNATYFNSRIRSFDADANLNQAGAVFVFNNADEESPWKKFTLGLNYISTNDFDNEVFSKGTGNTSIGSFFLAQAQGIPLDLLQLQGSETISDLYTFLGETQGTAAQNAFLGYQGFIFDPVDPTNSQNTQYTSNIASGTFNQEYAHLTRGYNGKYTMNFATQYNDNLFFGINLNTHIIDFDRYTYLYESNNNPGSVVTQVGFENNLSVLGSGFSAQIGAILKVADNSRISLSYDTPTWHVISEETTQYLETERVEEGVTIDQIVNPRVINVFEDYNLRTPGKVAIGIAQVFGKKGLISFDYSYKDYANTEFSPKNDPFFIAENAFIRERLKDASTYRLGGEYRIDNLSLRGGVRYEESPYQDEVTVGDLSGFSLGVGYNFGNYTFDISYARSEQSRSQQLYKVGLTDTVLIDTTQSNIVFTLGLNL
ncbi:MAG: outer membrane protein transport protein [Altibacter sp.]|nr:outer membrane protein transport protein [Altibacter sp.]